MKKDELKSRIVGQQYLTETKELKARNSYWEGHARGTREGLGKALELVEKLDETELPVIPQFVADHIELRKKVGKRLNVALSESPEANMSEKMNIAIFEANNIYARAWIDGYTIEKEKMYLIRFDENQYARKFNKSKIDSLLVIKEDAAEFTEQEIKAINERYWEFREEVQNEQ